MYLIHIFPPFPKSNSLQFNYTKNISKYFVCGRGWKSELLLWGIQGGYQQYPHGSADFQEWYARLYFHSSPKTVKSVGRLPLKDRILLGILPHISQQLQFLQQNSDPGTVVLHRENLLCALSMTLQTCQPAGTSLQVTHPCLRPCIPYEEGWYSHFKANKWPSNQTNVYSNTTYWLGWTILVSVLLSSHDCQLLTGSTPLSLCFLIYRKAK